MPISAFKRVTTGQPNGDGVQMGGIVAEVRRDICHANSFVVVRGVAGADTDAQVWLVA